MTDNVKHNLTKIIRT